MPNTKRIALFGLACSLLVFSGCLTSKKKPKPDTNVSLQVEEAFKQRWIEKRGAELTAGGLAPDVARGRAIEEFRERYEYTSAAKE
ncbi:MAG: hypothetical protein ACHQ5A_12855 [Opitutales bacterium]